VAQACAISASAHSDTTLLQKESGARLSAQPVEFAVVRPLLAVPAAVPQQ